MNANKRILIVVAHADDEVLGCFGSVAKLILQGFEAYTLILGEGKTSRSEKRELLKHQAEIELLEKEILKANKEIGISEVFREHFPDNRFDNVDFLDLVKSVERVKNIIKPSIVFTHFQRDLNIDHQLSAKAVITATRPIKDESVKEIYSFEVLSSTEWAYPLSFSPNVFFDISQSLECKIKAMKHYKSELCAYPHPRSLEGIELNAKTWGMKVGFEFAEAFESLRMLR